MTEETLPDWCAAAEDGDPEAQYQVAQYFQQSQLPGTEDDVARYLSMAVAQGHPRACLMLGLQLLPEHPEEALRHLRNAADCGLAEAMEQLGECYAQGLGVAPDPVQAEHWFCAKAQQGDGEAMLALARRYKLGNGVPRSLGRALSWLKRAQLAGVTDAQDRYYAEERAKQAEEEAAKRAREEEERAQEEARAAQLRAQQEAEEARIRAQQEAEEAFRKLVAKALSFVLIVAVSIPLGLRSAMGGGKLEGVRDGVRTVVNQLCMAVPPFFTGILLSWLFGTVLHWFIHGQFPGLSQDPLGSLGYLLFAAISLAIPRIAMTTRMLRGTIREELQKTMSERPSPGAMTAKACCGGMF